MASILGIDTIQHQSGTTAMTMDSTGRILTPARPHALVSFGEGTSGTYVSVNNNTVLPFDTIEHEVGSNYDTTNKRYVVPISGLYQVCFNCIFYSVTSFNCQLRLDGTVVHRWYIADSRHMTWTVLLEVSASSYFDIVHNTGSSRQLHGDNGDQMFTSVSYTLIG